MDRKAHWERVYETKQAAGEAYEVFEEPSIASIDNVVIVDDNVDVERDVQRARLNVLDMLRRARLACNERLVLIYAFGLRGGEPKDAKTIGQILFEIDGSQMTPVRVEAVPPQFLASTAKTLEKEGHLVIIDSAPKQSDLANLIIVASDILIIPVQPTYYDFRGYENFLENFRMFRNAKEANGGKIKAAIVLTRTRPNTIMLDS